MGMNYEEKKKLFSDNFSIGYLNTDFSDKIGLVALVCYITYEKQQKSPNVTTYKILKAITKNNPLPEEFITGLTIICDDFMYCCTTFPDFGLKTEKEKIIKIRSVLDTWIPF